MYKEWMNEKPTKKDFYIQENEEEKKVWVSLPDGKSEKKMEPLNLMMNDKHRDKLKDVAKKYILNGMRDYPQCFITIMAYNLNVETEWGTQYPQLHR